MWFADRIEDLSAYPTLETLVSAHELVVDAYRAGVTWLTWGSDFAHGQDWNVSPIYLSPPLVEALDAGALDGLLATRYAGIRKILAPMLPATVVCGFSRLRAGQGLKPHTHDNAGHLIFHMGVDIPPGCALQFERDGQTVVHEWKGPGDWVLFEDHRTHAAWNHSDRDRVIFYMDFMPDRLADPA